MQRLSSDRGAVGVLVAILMVPMLAAAALVIDLGSAYLRDARLQNGSDAAALAIAQNCARGNCGVVNATATSMAAANAAAGFTSATATVLGHTVTVLASGVTNFSLAPALGIGNKTLTTRSIASWGSPSGGRAMLPIAFSWCSFRAQTGGGLPTGTTPTTILLPKTDATACNGPSGNPVPGGFAWLLADSTGCTATTSIAAPKVYSDPGRSLPSICSVTDLTALQNRTVLLPVFDTFGSTGSNAWYHIYAYAAFRLTGYFFGGRYSWNPPCSGSSSCLSGYFTIFLDSSQAFAYSAGSPDLGARLVTLTG